MCDGYGEKEEGNSQDQRNIGNDPVSPVYNDLSKDRNFSLIVRKIAIGTIEFFHPKFVYLQYIQGSIKKIEN